MKADNSNRLIYTNIHIFYKIAKESYDFMKKDYNSSRRPRPDGEPGFIVTLDPSQEGFKSALITIVFCGVCLESVLHLLIVKNKDIEAAKKYDRKRYEDKLKFLGCNEPAIFEMCERFRASRRDVVHEKAHFNQNNIRWAQKEAKMAMELLEKVFAYFNVNTS